MKKIIVEVNDDEEYPYVIERIKEIKQDGYDIKINYNYNKMKEK